MKRFNVTKFFLFVMAILIFFSTFIMIGYSKEVGITDGLYVKYTYGISMTTEEFPATITFSKESDVYFLVEWELGGSVDDTGSWRVYTDYRSVTSMQNFGPDVGSRDFCWIYTDVSLNDRFAIFNFFKNDNTIYNITGESTHGSMEVWILEDDNGGVLWFEKTKGFLVNGTSRYGTDWQTWKFVETNAFETKAGIPGYNYFFLIGLFLIGAIVILKDKVINKENKRD